MTLQVKNACIYLALVGVSKSWAGARKLLLNHFRNRCQSLALAPTYGDLFRIIVPCIQSALDEWGISYKTYPNGGAEKKYPYIQVDGHDILLLSGDSPERLVGFEVGSIWADECARLKSSDIPMKDVPTLLRGRLRHPKAAFKQLILTSTPEGTNSWCYTDFVENKTDDRSIYIGSTLKNKALPLDYIKSLTSSYSSRLQAAYIHGQFINASANLQIWAFDRKYVITDEWVKQDEGKQWVSIDENVAPLSLAWGRYTKDKIWFRGEIQIKDNANVMQLVSRLNLPEKKFELFGDSSINKRNTIGKRFVDVFIEEATKKGFKIKDRVNKKNFNVFSTAERFNKLIEDDKVRFHSDCKMLIKDLENAQYKPGTLDTLKTNGTNSTDPHFCDLSRYLIGTEFMPNNLKITMGRV